MISGTFHLQYICVIWAIWALWLVVGASTNKYSGGAQHVTSKLNAVCEVHSIPLGVNYIHYAILPGQKPDHVAQHRFTITEFLGTMKDFYPSQLQLRSCLTTIAERDLNSHSAPVGDFGKAQLLYSLADLFVSGQGTGSPDYHSRPAIPRYSCKL